MKNTIVLIKGAGEMASAVAHRLFRGFQVIMTEVKNLYGAKTRLL